MLDITVVSQKIDTISADGFGFFVTEKKLSSPELKACEKTFGFSAEDFMKKGEFSGKKGQVLAFPIAGKGKVIHILIAGLGEEKKITLEEFRRALARAYRQATAHKVTTLAVALPAGSLFDLTNEELGEQVATILDMTAYNFDAYFSKENKKKTTVSKVILAASSASKSAVEKGVKAGRIIGEAVNKAREWINIPPSDLHPTELAKHAKHIAQKNNLKFTEFSEKEIIKMGMGGLAGVSRGSDQDCKLVILEYKSPKKNAETIAFVGKGITFDSGGLSLKPAAYMETMKEDMSGAAAVIASMEAIAKLKPNVNVIGVTPLAENLPSGKATKPGDILRFYNGKTAEVKNTDAEGRLILADALAYATKHYKPNAIIDIATLTGACAHALGPFFTGMMSQHDDLVEKVEESAEYTGDAVWPLPLTDDYKVAIKSDVADLCNIGNSKYMAGATTAGLFLQNFVDDIPWVHLDIGGTAFNVPDRPYLSSGATGVGVRLFIDIATHWK